MSTSKYLEFSLGEEDFAIPLMMVREVMPIPEMTAIPNVPSYFLGIMNLRGMVVTVIDLRSKHSIKPKVKDVEEAVIIINLEDITVGIVVDSINKFLDLDLDLDESEVKEVPAVDRIDEKPEGLAIILDIIKVTIDKLVFLLRIQIDDYEKELKQEPAVSKKPEKNISINLSRINKLNNMMGELVVLQTLLEKNRFSDIQTPLSNKSISQIGKIMKEVQEISMALRMIPLNATFNKMRRIVRDTSNNLGKDVELHLEGEDTEVDKTVLEHLSDHLVHIIRNAVAHGLEDTQERIKAGKDAKGHIEMKAFHEGSNLIIQISDDGNGIDPKMIRDKVIEKALISSAQVSGVSELDVGIDVVKTNIEKLSGEVKLESVIGKGSVFKIILPLTLAVIDAIVTKSGTERYIFPLAQIHEFVLVSTKNTKYVNGIGECILIRSETLPMFDLSKTFNCGYPDQQEDEDESCIAVVIRQEEFVFAVKVNEVINRQQVVIKQIGEEIKNQKGIMGSSVLADGKPAFIVDLLELYSDLLNNNKNVGEKSNEYF